MNRVWSFIRPLLQPDLNYKAILQLEYCILLVKTIVNKELTKTFQFFFHLSSTLLQADVNLPSSSNCSAKWNCFAKILTFSFCGKKRGGERKNTEENWVTQDRKWVLLLLTINRPTHPLVHRSLSPISSLPSPVLNDSKFAKTSFNLIRYRVPMKKL